MPRGLTTVPFADPNWNYNTAEGMTRCARFLEALIGGMKKGIQQPVNNDKLREITQGKDENPANFYSRLEETLRKYTNLDPVCREGQVLLGQYFISQSAPDIRRKLQKLQMGPQANQSQLLDTAFMVYNNRDLEGREREQSKEKRQASHDWHSPCYPRNV